ncbi:hypothetical protein VT98_11214 [Candidatus Electrothrix communis]|uniref:Uncharacterized protein n=1 Tax=Candidatus Electrothrix communis TaxID=1859133 RepID=A0A444J6K6_9BACT|nr:hypothetical protein VT98_11214 [Candidatus Electrothrix communis]
MDEKFLNCWEAKDCGREPNGKNVDQDGVCPVSVASSLDGIHNGKNGGRCCWTFASSESKYDNIILNCLEKSQGCNNCDFYKSVRDTTVLLVRA